MTGSTLNRETLRVTDPRSEFDQATDFHSEYEVLGEIGRGGMGVIYKAHQPRLNRIVALKVIHAASAAGEAARRRFQSEVEVAARLNHPNIVPIFDSESAEPGERRSALPGPGRLFQRVTVPGLDHSR